MHNPNFDPQEIAVTQVELATLLRRGFDHLATGSTEPLPTGTFTHPQTAATQATVLATVFAARSHTAEELTQWVQELEDYGLDAFRTATEETK